MKYFTLLFTLLLFSESQGQQSISSSVFQVQKPGLIFKGDGNIIKDVRFELISLRPNKAFKKTFQNQEGLVFIKKGNARFESASITQTLTPGSIGLVPQSGTILLKNSNTSPVEFYLFTYSTKSALQQRDTCKAFTRVWENLEFKPHERGGVRNYFSQATSQTKRFEMHVTTLLEGLPSHPPHTHAAEEIILVIEGDTEMEIGGKPFKGSAGDVYFVKSQEAHGIKNIGKSACSYYAFQWE